MVYTNNPPDGGRAAPEGFFVIEDDSGVDYLVLIGHGMTKWFLLDSTFLAKTDFDSVLSTFKPLPTGVSPPHPHNNAITYREDEKTIHLSVPHTFDLSFFDLQGRELQPAYIRNEKSLTIFKDRSQQKVLRLALNGPHSLTVILKH